MTDRTTEEAKREALIARCERDAHNLTFPFMAPTIKEQHEAAQTLMDCVAALQWQAEQQKGDDGRGLEACVTCGQPAASPHGVPPGYVLAPVEPTPEMLRAANKLPDTFSLGDEYRAMLSSLPQAPQGEQWISVHERLPELTVDNEDDGVKVYTWDGEFVTEDVFAPEYEQPAGPAVGGWLRTGDWFCSDTAARVTHWMLRRQPAPPPLAQGDSQ